MLQFIFLFIYFEIVESANILGVFIVPSISHQVVYQPIWRELSLRGHQVTVITPDPLNDSKLTNLTEIDVGFTYDIMGEGNIQSTLQKDLPAMKVISMTFDLLGKFAVAEITHPPVQNIIQDKTQKFDVLLVEFMHPLMYALSARFNCPMIGITSYITYPISHYVVGNPTHPELYPDLLLPFAGHLGFYERLYNSYSTFLVSYYYHYHVLPENDKIARKYISKDMPYLGDIGKNVSMLFLNVNPIIYPIRPNVPAVVELGKMHIQPKKPLPKDLQKELDDAKEGVVYLSLGTNARSANLTMYQREVILSCLAELPYKVFWKWEEDVLPGQPSNVVTRKWFPQQDILGHPNIKVFISQAGLQSVEESIINGVPLVGIPFYLDQPLNLIKMVDYGIARVLDPNRLTKEELKEAVMEVAENPTYRKRAKEIGNLLLDEPMTGLEKAVWWTEYVIRHKGARHLRSAAVDMPWYQYFLLDVIGFVLGAGLVSFWFLRKVIRLCFAIWKKFVVQSKEKMA